jgi:hypothetical protein
MGCEAIMASAQYLDITTRRTTGARDERTLFAVACKPLCGPDAAAPLSTGLERHRRKLRRETEIHLADRLVPIL